jgi:hypothetical protein
VSDLSFYETKLQHSFTKLIFLATKVSEWLLKGDVSEVANCQEYFRKRYGEKSKFLQNRGLPRGIDESLICAKNRDNQVVDTCEGF